MLINIVWGGCTPPLPPEAIVLQGQRSGRPANGNTRGILRPVSCEKDFLYVHGLKFHPAVILIIIKG